MKKSILLGSVALFYGTTAFGQGGNPGNNSLPGGFLGFNGIGLSQPLEIRNDFNQPINIYTSGIQRMSIRPNGRVGICSANRLSLSI